MGKHLNHRKRIDSSKRFLSKVLVTDNCWTWAGNFNKLTGYGHFWLNDSNMTAHRASWFIFYGDVPPKLQVCHKCDNRSCVNPEHLFLGTAKENAHDRVKKGRNAKQKKQLSPQQELDVVNLYLKKNTQIEISKIYNVSTSIIYRTIHRYLEKTGLKKGEENNKSVFTDTQIKEIRSKYIPYKYSFKRLADEYNVYETTIQRIIYRQTWKHI